MYRRFLRIASTHTVRQSLVTSASTFASAGLGAIFYLILARLLGPYEYGLFSIGLAILTTVVTVADVGMGQGLIRFVGQNRENSAYLPYAGLAFRTKLGISAACFFGSWLFADFVSSGLLHRPELSRLLPLVGLGIVSYLLFSFSSTLLLSLQQFLRWGVLQIGSNLLRLLLLGGVFLLLPLNSSVAFIVFSAASFAGFGMSWLWLDKRVISSPHTPEVSRKFWDFNRWTAAFMITASLVSRLDTFLTARFADLPAVGVYSLAVTMVSFLPQLSTAIGAVTATRFASFTDRAHAAAYLKKALLFSSAVGLLVALLMIPTALIVTYLAGPGYMSALPPFGILLAALLIFVTLNPLRDSLLYFYHRPAFFFWASLAQGATLFLSAQTLIPRWGISGSALSVLVSHILLAGLCLVYYHRVKTSQ